MLNIFNARNSSNVVSFEARKEAKPNDVNYVSQTQYFFCDPDSELPVRDVLNKMKQGFKTEPHIENKSENFLKRCTQSKIKASINADMSHLFLLAKCTNKKLKEYYNNQFIVGYIKIKDVLERKDKKGKFASVQGDIKIVSWKDAFSIKDHFGFNFGRPEMNTHGRFDKTMTNKLLDYFKGKKDITQDCINEIIKLDTNNISCEGKSCVSCGNCTRWQQMQKTGQKGTFVA